MLDKRTVLVLGAGASKPYGLPLGFELRDAVLGDATSVVFRTRRGSSSGSRHEFEAFCRDLAESGFSSVDAYLEQRPTWTEIGKSTMALCLLSSECKAKDRLFPPHQPKDHWYEVLWSCLRAPSWHAFKAQPVSIVTFNYDRSLEHYLTRVLNNNYRIKADTVKRALPILHVHGSLGEYEGVFGESASETYFTAAAGSIRVVHEADTEDVGFIQAREWISAAQRVVFVGFGYHDANMRKLGFEGWHTTAHYDRTVAGTHKGIRAAAWFWLCRKYGFSPQAAKGGAGSMSEFVAGSLA